MKRLLDPRNKHFQLELSTLWPIEKVYLPFLKFHISKMFESVLDMFSDRKNCIFMRQKLKMTKTSENFRMNRKLKLKHLISVPHFI